MTMTAQLGFLGGLIAMGHLVAAAFFLRFWRRTRDGLFLAFSAAFALMSLNQALVILLQVPREDQSLFFLLRLAAFSLIIGAILVKNLGGRRRP
jgi:NAD/NADP transhydrogenase beta subunit